MVRVARVAAVAAAGEAVLGGGGGRGVVDCGGAVGGVGLGRVVGWAVGVGGWGGVVGLAIGVCHYGLGFVGWLAFGVGGGVDGWYWGLEMVVVVGAVLEVGSRMDLYDKGAKVHRSETREEA